MDHSVFYPLPVPEGFGQEPRSRLRELSFPYIENEEFRHPLLALRRLLFWVVPAVKLDKARPLLGIIQIKYSSIQIVNSFFRLFEQ